MLGELVLERVICAADPRVRGHRRRAEWFAGLDLDDAVRDKIARRNAERLLQIAAV